jgi:hypothetical protein
MNFKLIRGYVEAVIVVTVVVLAAILVVGNIGESTDWRMWILWRTFTFHPAAVLLGAALAGVVLLFVLTRILPNTLRAIRSGKASQHQADVERQVKDLSARQEERQKE